MWARFATIAAAAVIAIGLAAPADASHRWQPRHLNTPAPALGSYDNPMHVHNTPSENPGGGSRAWADYGLWQVLRASRPSAAARAICQLDEEGDFLVIDGGMMLPGVWVATAVGPVQHRKPGDVSILVDDPDGSHGGDCAPVGLVLRLS